MKQRSILLFLLFLWGAVGLVGCQQSGAPVDGSAAPSSPQSDSSDALNSEEVSQILALNGMSVQEVVESLMRIQGAHHEFSSGELALQLDRALEIHCGSQTCDILRKDPI